MINLFLSNKRYLLLLILLFSIHQAFSQTNEYSDKDSVFVGKPLSEVVISAFNQNKKLSDQSAAISYITTQNLNRYSPTNIASAMNAVPGVHMDLRSPGSMRINIRGSSLRAPFGVRNVKIYYNGIPLTDPGGNTYLNQLSFDDYSTVQIIKGPSGSLYGAGIGGVMLIKGPLFSKAASPTNKVTMQISRGSFGLKKRTAHVAWGKKGNGNILRFSDLRKDGYRNHSSMKRQTASYNTRLKINSKEALNAFFHYTNLFYQTPGALTKNQYMQHPKASRPASGSQPSAKESKAAVYQKAFVAGIEHTYQFSPYLKNTTVLYGTYTDFTNPTTRNYELRKEPHFGGRTVFQYTHSGDVVLSNYWLGAEVQQGYFSQKDFGNHKGRPDTLQLINRTNQFNSIFFVQGEWQFPHDWDLTTALSLNHQSLTFTKLYPGVATTFEKTYPLITLPRIALSKKINPHLLFYINISKGFSPPTVPELLPSTNILNKNLQAEKGINYELGSKGTVLHQRLYYEASAYITQLSQSISQRNDSTGADYFVNAGGMTKKGFEIYANYNIYKNPNHFFNNIHAWFSQTIFNARYKDYYSGEKDYSGNSVPGTASYILASGLDLQSEIGLNAHITFQHTSKIPLNDANNVYASAYNLLGFKLDYHKKISNKIGIQLSTGGDNLLNEKYSLGNDINPFGGRYYNAAPTTNFYFNIGIHYFFKEK